MTSDVIDACSIMLDRAGWRLYLERFRRHAPEYIRVFAKSWCRFFGADLQAFVTELDRDWDSAMSVLMSGERPELIISEHVRDARSQGLSAEFVVGSPARRPDGLTVNEWLLEQTAPFRQHFAVWAGVELGRPGQFVDELVAGGAEGLCVIPFIDGAHALDASSADLWSAAERAGLPVWLHTGHHLAASQPSGIHSWLIVDELARRHPDLTIVAGHAGWPDVAQMLLTASRHRHVFLEISSHRPRSMPAAGSGWEFLLAQHRGLARDRILFGTSSWVNPVPTGQLADELRALDLDTEVTELWLSGNARRLRRR